MNELRAPHLSDAEIDAYWKGGLPAADEARVEDHYLDCGECAARVKLVEDLVTHLPVTGGPDIRAGNVRAWQAVAAVFAGLAVVAGWQWAQIARGTGEARPGVRPPAAVSRAGGSSVTLAARLEPPTRDAAVPELALAPTTEFVIFELDAREGGAPGTRFEVSLGDPTGGAVMRLARVESAADGLLRVPLAASLLTSGRYVFELAAGPTVVSYPFLIRRE